MNYETIFMYIGMGVVGLMTLLFLSVLGKFVFSAIFDFINIIIAEKKRKTIQSYVAWIRYRSGYEIVANELCSHCEGTGLKKEYWKSLFPTGSVTYKKVCEYLKK